MTIPVPTNESERVRALYDLDILDTPSEERFDRITRLASQLVRAPIVLISLVDDDRQWFKSRVGLEARETPRDMAFCTHAIMDSKVFVISDAMEDDRFRDNPLVTGDPSIRFYAGAPLTLSDGVQIGTLCAIDTKPRELTSEQEEALQDLSRIVVDELKLRQHVVELRRTRAELELANESLEEFAHLAAHDLRAPVKTLINMSDIVRTTSGERQERGLEMIREAAVEAETLISGYRRLSVLRMGDAALARVSDLLEEASSDFALRLDVALEGDAEIVCDSVLMKQALVNLLQNVERHGADHHVSVECAERDGTVSIRVSNRPREPHSVDQSILAPFKQITEEEEGSGLGLSIVHRIARLHGGWVRVEGDEESFSIEIALPIKVEAG